MTKALTIPISRGSDPEPIEIDDAHEIYGGREEIAIDEEFDDQGNGFEACPSSDNGHLFKTECGRTICLHCGRISWQ